MKTFYMVKRDDSDNNSRCRYETFEEALTEAKRLCRRENDSFVILKAIAVVAPEAVPVSVTDLEEED